MIFETNTDELVLISEDVMEASYLESLFSDSVRIVCNSDFVTQGFHVTDERVISITLTKRG